MPLLIQLVMVGHAVPQSSYELQPSLIETFSRVYWLGTRIPKPPMWVPEMEMKRWTSPGLDVWQMLVAVNNLETFRHSFRILCVLCQTQ